jgi:hypothetical protein
MLKKLTSLIESIQDGEIKDKLIVLAENVRPKDHLLIDIREFSGLIDPNLVEPVLLLGEVEIQL